MIKGRFNYSTVLIIILLIAYCLVILPYIHTVPIWDAWINVDYWIQNAIKSPFNLLNFDNGGHPAFVWMLLLGSLQYLDFGNVLFLHSTVLLFSLISIFSFYKLIKTIFRSDKFKWDNIIITALYSFYPIFNASALHINQDYGVLIFFVIFLSCLFLKKNILALLSGIGLVFSKEPGIVLFTLSLFFSFLSELYSSKHRLKRAFLWIYQSRIFILPYVLFLLRIYLRIKDYSNEVFLVGFNPLKNDLSMIYPTFSYEMLTKVPYSYLLAIFFIQFNWILSVVILVGLIVFLFYIRNKVKIEIDTKIIFIILGLYIFSIYFFLLYKTYTNLRYFLPIYLLEIILFYVGLSSIFYYRDTLRKIFLLIVFILLFISQYRLIDPFSKIVYGTFKFGRHDFLNMTSITGECCGYGRDQLVYNFQFTEFDQIQNLIYKDLKPNHALYIAYDKWNSPDLMGFIDKNTYTRSFSDRNVIYPFENSFGLNKPLVVNWKDIESLDQDNMVYFIEFPNMENKSELRKYLKYYYIEETKIYTENGYSINVYKLKRNETYFK